jgi:hypothetical protein
VVRIVYFRTPLRLAASIGGEIDAAERRIS